MKREILVLALILVALPFALATECLDAVSQTQIRDEGYTYLDSGAGVIGVQVQVGSHPTSFQVVGVDVAVNAGGVTRVMTEMISIGQNEVKALTFSNIAFKDAQSATISIAPIIQVNNTQMTCDVSSVMSVNTITASSDNTGRLVPISMYYEIPEAEGSPAEPYAKEAIMFIPILENQGDYTIPKDELLANIPDFDLEDFVLLSDIYWVPNGGYWNPTYSAGLAPGQRARVWVWGYFNSPGNKGLTMTTSTSDFTTGVTVLSDPGCYDSDGGNNRFTKGWTIGGTACSNQDNCPSSNRMADECRGYDLLEFFCEADYRGVERKYVETIECPGGCENGACVNGDVIINRTEPDCTWPRGCCDTDSDCSSSAPYCIQSAAYEGPKSGRGVCSPGQAGHYCDKSQGSNDCRTSLVCNVNCDNYGELSWCSPMFKEGEQTVDEGVRCESCSATNKICGPLEAGDKKAIIIDGSLVISSDGINADLSINDNLKYEYEYDYEAGAITTESKPVNTNNGDSPTGNRLLDTLADCNGCQLGEDCFIFGYRKSGRYCEESGIFSKYKPSKEFCENNFECKSNLCIDNECISGGLFKSIANWFRRVFGEQ